MDELTKIALVGTSRYTGPVPGNEHPAAGLVTGSSNADRERVLLLRCGAQSIYRLAGRCAVAGIDSTDRAPPETKAVASAKLAAILHDVAGNDQIDLLVDCLQKMPERGIILSPEVLPRLLATKNKVLRRHLLPVLGERGTWLCGQNPDWADLRVGGPSVSENADDVPIDVLRQTWDEGTIDARCVTIGTVRRRDPTTAREWIIQAFPRENASDRVRLVKCLATSLCEDDEPFLETCLNDRSAAVGRSAARLLCRVPQSALAARMRERADAMLELECKGLAFKSVKLVCTPPQKLEPAWERDGVPEVAPKGVGQRGFWAETVLAAVTPSHWQTAFGLEPQALIDAVTEDPFASSVAIGWTEATARFAPTDTTSSGWVAPLWQYWSRAVKGLQGTDRERGELQMTILLGRMSVDRAEASIVALFESAQGWDEADALGLLLALERPWHLAFTKAFLATARKMVQTRTDQPAYQWALAVNRFACAIPAEAFPLALAPWEVAPQGETTTWLTSSIRTALDKFIAAIETRQSFMNELNQ